MSSGRLPSLKDSAKGKPGLKFKPKAVARKSKEERDASALKIKKDEDLKLKNDQYKKGKKPLGQTQKKRLPRYLNNTHVISTGPLAAGNFTDSGKNDFRRGIVKMEGGDKSLVRKGLQSIENHTGDSDDEYHSDGKEKLNIIEGGDSNYANQARFNMGREYTSTNFQQDDSDAEEEELDMEEEAIQRRRIEELFPVRPLRIRHEDVEVLENKITETVTETTTREPTPGVSAIKTETDPTLHDVLKIKEAELQNELNKLQIDPDSQAIDEEEVKHEQAMLIKDHISILKKLDKMNKKHDRFLLFQMPYKLPLFDEVNAKKEDTDISLEDAEKPNEKDTEKDSDKKLKKKSKKSSKKKEHVLQEELTGHVGSIRIHKSGRLSIKIGNSIMDISKASESSFLQDVIALNEDPEAPGVELFGRVEGKVMVTPSFDI